MTARATIPSGGRLKRVAAEALTIRRLKRGRGFSYDDGEGHSIRDPETLARIRSLAIPPAYADVRIAADPRAHLQAVGRDDAGRIQHRYHPDWERVRERRKLAKLSHLVGALPKIRAAIARDLKLRTLSKQKALACAACLIDRCHIRVGSESYAKENGSYGASTLLKRHVAVVGGRVELKFRGKSGKDISCACDFAPLARALTRIMTLPGRRLFQYRREDGTVGALRAGDINAYLAEVAGMKVSSKDLRMLAANAAAAELLLASDIATSETARKRQLADIMRAISERLVNTPAVVRKSYVHQVVVQSYATGKLKRSYERARARNGCTRIERALGLLSQ